MKTAELTDAWLEYWTARAKGIPAEQLSIHAVAHPGGFHCVRRWQTKDPIIGPDVMHLGYSTDWRLTGPLIAKHQMEFRRALVRSVFGDEVPDVEVTK